MICGIGCAEEVGGDEVETDVVGGMDARIFGGSTDDDKAGASNVVALKVGDEGEYELCSGALVAPNVVLTARHCVAKVLTATVTCDENGSSTNGRHVKGNLPPSHIKVYTGASPRFSSEPIAVGKKIIAPDSDTLCDADIALVVLDAEVPDVEPFAVRVGSKVGVVDGETVRSVGYGQNDKRMPLGTRLKKDNVSVLAMGRGISASKTALGVNEFEVGRSICEGDSGGPAISEETGAVIGVVSRGGNCNDDFGHIYIATARFKELFDRAFAAAGGAPIVETGQPEGPQTKANPVALREPPPETETTLKTSAGGCSAAPGRETGAGSLLLALAAVVVLRRRHNRR
ncbi:MAG: S1 family peptidase [Labilithrix sp.]|nr:S1 family peptidase [Labilithrix sp.]MCW5816084.1 S1 family peptidase [Labilithrix sp.]